MNGSVSRLWLMTVSLWLAWLWVAPVEADTPTAGKSIHQGAAAQKEAASEKKLEISEDSVDDLLTMVLSPDGRHLYVADCERGPGGTRISQSVVDWDIGTGRKVRSLPVGHQFWGLTISPDGKTLLAVGID